MNKIIIGGIIIAVAIIAIGALMLDEKSENFNIDDENITQEIDGPKKITLELSDAVNLGEGGP